MYCGRCNASQSSRAGCGFGARSGGGGGGTTRTALGSRGLSVGTVEGVGDGDAGDVGGGADAGDGNRLSERLGERMGAVGRSAGPAFDPGRVTVFIYSYRARVQVMFYMRVIK
jgi:hypothetical protein